MSQTVTGRKELGWVHWLRVLGAFAVIVIHVCAKDFTIPPVTSFAWRTLNAYECLVRWAVPVFVMVSGALLLDPERDMSLQKLFGQYFLRILTALVFWSLAYAAAYQGFYLRGGLPEILSAAWEGYPHLWYLYMLLGLYLVTPLLRPLARSRETMRYFTVLAAVFAVVLPTCGKFGLLPMLRYAAGRLEVHAVMGYAGYFVLGRLLAVTELKRGQRVLLYALALLSVAAAMLTGWLGSAARGKAWLPLNDYFSLTTALEAAAVFVLVRTAVGSRGTPRWIRSLSALSFGIYLIHEVPIDFLRRFCGLSTMRVPPLVSVPLIALLSFGIAAAATAVVKRIPGLGKFLV